MPKTTVYITRGRGFAARASRLAPDPSIEAVELSTERGFAWSAERVSPFDPGTVFNPTKVGAFWDPSDISTLFQDRAGTIPVTADGDPVGFVVDKSTGGYNLVAISDAARPVYGVESDGRAFLKFNGAQSLRTAKNIVPPNAQQPDGTFKLADFNQILAYDSMGQISGRMFVTSLSNIAGHRFDRDVNAFSGNKTTFPNTSKGIWIDGRQATTNQMTTGSFYAAITGLHVSRYRFGIGAASAFAFEFGAGAATEASLTGKLYGMCFREQMTEAEIAGYESFLADKSGATLLS
jgi:hypothetical protein